jgi:hypothetical protein
MLLPGLADMLQMIIDKNSMFPVVRSNGKIEVGWRVYDAAFACIQRNRGEWYIPCINDAMILKPVKIKNFLSTEFPAEFPAAVEKALAVLNAGVYARYVNEPADAIDSPCETVAVDTVANADANAT